MPYRIPFNKPFIVGKELYYVAQSVLQEQISGDGPYTRKAQQLLQDVFGVHRILLTTSCTAALELAAILSNLKEGDEVILPSFTFSSTANAFLLCRARLVFVDCRPDTLNLDEKQIETSITERTRVIVPVHYAGIACEMDSILSLAQKYHLLVVEDAAQGVNSKYKGRFLGTLGDIGTYSFHAGHSTSKNMHSLQINEEYRLPTRQDHPKRTNPERAVPKFWQAHGCKGGTSSQVDRYFPRGPHLGLCALFVLTLLPGRPCPRWTYIRVTGFDAERAKLKS